MAYGVISPRQPVSRLEISVQCMNLSNKDIKSKSDPCVQLFQRHATWDDFAYVCQTEVKRDDLNPTFTTALMIDYFFEEKQYLRFKVIDVDKGKNTDNELRGNDLGVFECTLGEILGKQGNCIYGKLHKKGQIQLVAEECSLVKGAMSLSLHGIQLANKDGWFGKSDPCFILSKLREDGHFTEIYRSEVVKSNLNPVWKPFVVPLNRLCQGDMLRPIKLEVNDKDTLKKFDRIGVLETTAQELLKGEQLLLKHPKGKSKAVGQVGFTVPPRIVHDPTFMDYISGGMEISVTVAIDFTQSNGIQTEQSSLHYNSPDTGHMNCYEAAISAVVSTVAPYDHDQYFLGLGYGAILPRSGPDAKKVSHCFPLSGNWNTANLPGVKGILQEYNRILPHLTLAGPTLFAPIIKCTAKHVRAQVQASPKASQKYNILLIITDGAIMDLSTTITEIVKASDLPLSIVIIGVGNADFSTMEKLDGDNVALTCEDTGKCCKRDIVQFVEFQKYSGPTSGPRLACDVLAEIPRQVVQYYMQNDMPPNPIQSPQQPVI